ncbi:MAG: hypothetical protein AAF745_14170, partial [Planctomycetota bacterium]
MSTSGNLGGQYGQRQSWRRGDTGQAGKRRTAKIVLTLIALLLTAWFAYLILRPTPKRRLQTIVVSNSYDIDIVTPPMFESSVQQAFRNQLDAKVLSGDSQQIRRAFGESDLISQPLGDVDDTVMIVLRGYLMLGDDNQPALACSDLSLRQPTNLQPTDLTPDGGNDDSSVPSRIDGLVPIAEILEPLATRMQESFRGVRLLVLDIEPLAAHPALGQWNETVFARLEQTVRQMESPAADRVFVICTRGPLQNVGWDANNKMPIATQTLLEAMSGAADLDSDRAIELDELCAFMADRFEQLPYSSSTDIPRLTVMQAGTGIVDTQAASRGDMDLWLAYAPKPEPISEPETDPEIESDASTAMASTASPPIAIRNVAWQTPDEPLNQPAENDKNEIDDTAAAPASGAASGAASGDGQNTTETDAAQTNPINPTSIQFATSQFWDIRDRFESIEFATKLPATKMPATTLPTGTLANPIIDAKQPPSVIALAPHLWRQLVLKVLGNELRNYDPESSNPIPDKAAEDLRRLRSWLSEATPIGRPRVNDSVVTRFVAIASQQLDRRRTTRVDRRVMTADALQHAIAVGRTRLWSWVEYQRQAALGGQPIAKPQLATTVIAAERLLALSQADQMPGQVELDARLSDLKTAIELFDRGLETAVSGLIKQYSRLEPGLTWELNRAAWAWLRSPLPSGDQRRRLIAAIQSAPPDPADRLRRGYPALDSGRLLEEQLA